MFKVEPGEGTLQYELVSQTMTSSFYCAIKVKLESNH